MSSGAWRDAAAQQTVSRRRWKPAASPLVILVMLAFFWLSSAATDALAKGAGGGQRCSKKNPCETTPPTVAISSPLSGSTTAGMVTIAGTASDNGSVAKVDVSVDGASTQAATGTTNWTVGLNTTAYADGVHTVTATATDSAGNVGTASISIDVSNTLPSAADVVTNAAVSQNLVLLGPGRMAELGSVSVLLYREEFSSRPWAQFRDASSGAYTNVPLLPAGAVVSGWEDARWALTGQKLLVFSGNGPIVAREYQLWGSPLPTSATLTSTTTFGDADSRVGDFIGLSSGGFLGVWHQQGVSGLPQGQGIAYLSPVGSWSTIYPLQFMPTRASRQAVAQQPADGSIWVFSDPDMWHAIGAMHLTEGPSGIRVNWTDGTFISVPKDGDYGPDPERPDVIATPDPSTGTIALAYQSNVRQIFSTAPWVVGSYVAVARIAPDGGTSFLSLPIPVERISGLGLVVRPGETWLAYRPVDPTTLTFDHLYMVSYSSGSWGAPTLLGTLYTPYEEISSGAARAAFVARLTDIKLHLFEG